MLHMTVKPHTHTHTHTTHTSYTQLFETSRNIHHLTVWQLLTHNIVARHVTRTYTYSRSLTQQRNDHDVCWWGAVNRWIDHSGLWRITGTTPDLRLPSQPRDIAALRLVPNYRPTVWWQTHECVNNLPKVTTRQRNGREWNSWADESQSNEPHQYRPHRPVTRHHIHTKKFHHLNIVRFSHVTLC